MTAFIPVKPAVCGHCHTPLHGDNPNPLCHQVTEIPPLRAVTYEDHLHSLTCPCCRQHPTADLPPGVPTGNFGPRWQAVVAVQSGYHHLRKRQTQTQLHDYVRVTVSPGSISNLEHATSAAVAAPVVEARPYVREQAAVHVDETSWREGSGPRKAWLWTAVTTWVTVFSIRLQHLRRW